MIEQSNNQNNVNDDELYKINLIHSYNEITEQIIVNTQLINQIVEEISQNNHQNGQLVSQSINEIITQELENLNKQIIQIQTQNEFIKIQLDQLENTGNGKQNMLFQLHITLSDCQQELQNNNNQLIVQKIKIQDLIREQQTQQKIKKQITNNIQDYDVLQEKIELNFKELTEKLLDLHQKNQIFREVIDKLTNQDVTQFICSQIKLFNEDQILKVLQTINETNSFQFEQSQLVQYFDNMFENFNSSLKFKFQLLHAFNNLNMQLQQTKQKQYFHQLKYFAMIFLIIQYGRQQLSQLFNYYFNLINDKQIYQISLIQYLMSLILYKTFRDNQLINILQLDSFLQSLQTKDNDELLEALQNYYKLLNQDYQKQIILKECNFDQYVLNIRIFDGGLFMFTDYQTRTILNIQIIAHLYSDTKYYDTTDKQYQILNQHLNVISNVLFQISNDRQISLVAYEQIDNKLPSVLDYLSPVLMEATNNQFEQEQEQYLNQFSLQLKMENLSGIDSKYYETDQSYLQIVIQQCNKYILTEIKTQLFENNNLKQQSLELEQKRIQLQNNNQELQQSIKQVSQVDQQDLNQINEEIDKLRQNNTLQQEIVLNYQRLLKENKVQDVEFVKYIKMKYLDKQIEEFDIILKETFSDSPINISNNDEQFRIQKIHIFNKNGDNFLETCQKCFL